MYFICTPSARIASILLVAALAALAITPARAQVPQLINYQGRVVVGPTNFNGSGQFKFALVDTTGATTYWSNDGTSTAGSAPASAVALNVSQGLYSVALGDTTIANMTTIPPSVFGNSDVRLRVWFNDGVHGFQQLTPDQRITAVGYAMFAASVPNGSITSAQLASGAVGTAQIANGAVGSAQIANGAVGTAQFAPNSYLNGTAANVPLSGITGAGSGVLAAAANPANSANGLSALNSNGTVPASSLSSSSMRIYQPTTTVNGATSVQPFNVVCDGDSIVAGGGATVPYPGAYGATPVLNPSAYPSTLQSLGFCAACGTVWPLGMGSETVANGTSHFYSSQGQNCLVSLTQGSTTGTLIATPQFIINGGIVTGSGIPPGTTMTNTQVVTTASIPSGSTTITVASATGIVNNMYPVILAYSATGGSNGSFAANCYVTNVSGTTITLSAATTSPGNSLSGVTVIFFSNAVTLSAAFTELDGTATLTSAGTLLSGTATFTKGSTSATVNGTVTGLAPSSIWSFGMGSTCTPPGDTITAVSGSALTLSQSATASGTVTFYASAPVHDATSDTTFYPQGINTTPYLLSPNVTGVPGYFLCEYGLNNSSVASNTVLSSFETDYAALISDATGAGYSVCYQSIVPPCSNNLYSEQPSLVSQYNGWLQSQPSALGGASLIDIASIFPAGNVAIGDYFHAPDGVHPSNMGHALMGSYINDSLFQLFASSSNTYTAPLANGALNASWLPVSVPQTDLSNTFGTEPTSSTAGTALNQEFVGSVEICSASTTNPTLTFDIDYYGTEETAWTISTPWGQGSTGALSITDSVNKQAALVLPVSPNSNAATFGGGLSINASASNGANGPQGSYGLTVNGNAGTGCLMSDDFGQTNDFILKNLFSNKGFQFWNSSGTNYAEIESTGVVLPTAGTTISLKGGTNAASGTVTLSGGAGTISSTAITTNSVIILSIKSAGGTPGTAMPQVTVSSGSASVRGLNTDSSTYNWAMLIMNQ